MKCPCCDGSGVIPLTPMQYRVWDVLRRSPDGLAAADLTQRVYSSRADGGPDSGVHCIWSHAFHANKRLTAIGQRIVASGGPGSIYRLVRVQPATVEHDFNRICKRARSADREIVRE
jgi:hypothetical protein